MTTPANPTPLPAQEGEVLAPCPFCGEKPALVTRGEDLLVFRCPDHSPCHGSGLLSFGQASKQEQVLAAWNTRTSDPTHDARIRDEALAEAETVITESALPNPHWGTAIDAIRALRASNAG